MINKSGDHRYGNEDSIFTKLKTLGQGSGDYRYGDEDPIFSESRWYESELETYQCLRPFENAGVKIKLADPVVLSDAAIWITDSVIPTDHVALHPEYWGIYSYTPIYQNRLPVRLFNCFINRICPNRQSWFYQFVRNDLLSKGYVSFRVSTNRTPYKNLDPISANDAVFNFCNHIFQQEHNQMRQQVPFCNFTGSLDQVIVDSKISLVLETCHDNPNIFFTEKTFRALQLPRPFVIFAYPGAISILRNYGFEVWDDLVDNRYDTIIDHRAREKMILNEVKRFDQIEYDERTLAIFEAKAQYNRSLLTRLRIRWPGRLKSVIQALDK